MASTDTATVIATEVARAFQPLEDAFSSPLAFQVFMAQLGWTATSIPAPIQALMGSSGQPGPLQVIINDVEAIAAGNVPPPTTLATHVLNLVNAIDGLSSSSGQFDATFLANNVNFLATFPGQLVSYLLVDYLQSYHPAIGFFLSAIGLVRKVYVSSTATQPGFVQVQLVWSDIPLAVSNPIQLFQNAYQWGTNQFDSTSVMRNVRNFLISVGASADLVQMPEASAQKLESGAPMPGSPTRWQVQMSFFYQQVSGAEVTAGVSLLPLPAVPVSPTTPVALLPGLALMPFLEGNFTEGFPITPNLTFSAQYSFDFTGGVGLTVRPGQGLQVVTGFNATPPNGATAQGSLKLKLTTVSQNNSPIILMGSSDSTRVQVQSASGSGGIQLTGQNDIDFFLELDLNGGQIVISVDDADNFVSSLLPAGGLQLNFNFGLGWSRSKGLYFTGSASLTASLPVHLQLGPITLDTIYLTLGTKNNAITLEVSVDAEGTLGPISVSVEKIGFDANFTFPRSSGNGNGSGPVVDFGCGFKAPTGLGLDIESSTVSGGGFISFNKAKQEYSGSLELTIEMLQLKAFGLLDTIMPDGSEGFSFVIIIIADFVPIQLGFGFELTGVGGILGINRTMSSDALRAAFRAHTIDKTLFLTDPASQGTQITQNIAAIFPIMPGDFVFGPMVQISWGEPEIVTAEIAVVVTMPDPVVLAILGYIVVAVPEPEDAIIDLNLDVLGMIDFNQKLISIDASLYNSYVAAFGVAGDMAFRMNYGESPSFALSIGGLNPNFQPPPGFPTLTRLTISLGWGSDPSLSVEGYFAVTSNSVQFGAKAELMAQAAGFGVHGYVGFDVLIILDPFGFLIDFSAGIDILAGNSVIASINVDGSLSGTSPWHVHGDASFSIFFFKVHVNIDKTFGQSGPPQVPATTTLLPPFTAALNDARNWKAVLPPDAGRVATLAAIPATATQVVVHPIGQLTFLQTVAPLDMALDYVNGAVPTDANQLTIAGTILDPTGAGFVSIPAGDIIPAEFADGQFFKMSDQDKISKPSFTPHDAGATFGLGQLAEASLDVPQPVTYDTIIHDDVVLPTRLQADHYPLLHDTAMAMAGHSASALSPRRNSGAQKYVPPGLTSGVTTTGPQYVVVSATDLSVQANVSPATGRGYTDVQASLNNYEAANPSVKGTLQILSLYELQLGAAA